MPQVSVAIDFSSRSAHIAVWEATFRKAELRALRTVTFDAETTEQERWQRVFEALPKHVDTAVASVDPARTSTHLMSFPFTDLRKVEAALQFELEGQIPYSVDDIASTWIVTSRAHHGRTDVMAAVAPKTVVAGQLAAMTLAGFEPRVTVLPGVVLEELLQPAQMHDEAVAVLALGASCGHLAVLRDGVRYVRTLRAGGDDIDRVLARVFEIPAQQACEIKHAHGAILDDERLAKLDGDDRKLAEAIRQGLKPLISALRATLKALPTSQLPNRVHLTGGASRLAGLDEFLSRALGIPVELLDLRAGRLSDLQCSMPAIGPEYAVVLGLALSHMRHGRGIGLNFRRGELAYQGDFQLYRGQIKHVALGLGIVFLLALVGSALRMQILSAEEARVDSGFGDATERIVGRRIPNPTAALATMRQAPGVSEGVAIPAYSAATLYEMVSKAIGTDVDVSFEELEFRVEAQSGGQDRITGKGEAASFETTERVVATLKRDPCVQEVEVSKQRKQRTSARVEFHLAVKVSCPVGVNPGERQGGVAQVAPAEPSTTDEPVGLDVPPPDMLGLEVPESEIPPPPEFE